MRSISFGGVCLDELCVAEVIDVSAASAVASTIAVPGRPGALVLGADLAPRPITVKLYLDAGYMPGSDRMAMIHRQVGAALTSMAATTLELPSSLEYHDVLCVNAGTWESLYEDGSCTLQFVAYNPIAYGREIAVENDTWEIEGTWPVAPRLELYSYGETALTLNERYSGLAFELENLGRFGQTSQDIVIDCERQLLTVNGEDARACIALGSQFFTVGPGKVEFDAGSGWVEKIIYRERWA